MPRKTTKSLVRKVSPDRRYQSIMVQRLINKSMLNGKKQVAERAVYAAIEGAAKKLKSENPVEVLEKAIANILSTTDNQINLLEQKLSKLELEKKGLMQKLLTGKIRVGR